MLNFCFLSPAGQDATVYDSERNNQVVSKVSKIAILAFAFILWPALPAPAMNFSEQFNGAMRIDAESMWIYAEGEITDETPAAFEAFLLEAAIWKNQRIVLNSPGGKVLAGMKLGSIIRERGFRTSVASSSADGEYYEIGPGECASSCVFAFAGGVERSASEGSRVGVHQASINFKTIWSSAAPSINDLSQTFSTAQSIVGTALTFFLDMGIDPSIVTLMVTEGPEEIRWLTKEEARATKIAYQPNSFAEWKIEPFGKGLVAFSRSVDGHKQLTLFCSAKRMKFRITASKGIYQDNFIEILNGVKAIEVAGVQVGEANFNIVDQSDGLTITGDWPGSSEQIEDRSTFSLDGNMIGSLADLYSLYEFNQTGFASGVRLARKNCIS